MATKSFSKKEAISYGWKTTKSNFRFFLLLIPILLAVQFLPGFFRSNLHNAPFLSFLISLCFSIIRIITSLGEIRIALNIHDKKKAKLSDLFSHAEMVINYFLASVLYGLIVFAGFLLLIIPGIVWAIKFQYYPYFIVDKKLPPIDSLKASSKITQGVKWSLFWLGLELAVIYILGFLALGVGIFLTMPTVMLAQAYVFRKLEK